MRSVKTCPRSRSPAIWISSIARNAASTSFGSASTVQTRKRRRSGDDLLFPGDQRDLVRADALDDAVVDLARQQPERQADDACRVASMRSMARWVLPVLVGPRTATTLRPPTATAVGEILILLGRSPSSAAKPQVATAAPQRLCTIARADIRAKSLISGTSLTGGTSLEQNRPESLTGRPFPVRSPRPVERSLASHEM